MTPDGVIAQLRTTDLEGSIAFWTERIGLALAFRFQDFYAGIRAGQQVFHLKRVDAPDPSIPHVAQDGHFHLYLTTGDASAMAAAIAGKGVTLAVPVHDTAWATREFVFHDDQGHTIYAGEAQVQ